MTTFRNRPNPYASVSVSTPALASPGWSWSGVRLDRLPGGLWSLSGVVSNGTGSPVTAGADGNVTDVEVAGPGALPANCYSTDAGHLVAFPAIRSGQATWWMCIHVDGRILLTHGAPGITLPAGASLSVRALWHLAVA